MPLLVHLHLEVIYLFIMKLVFSALLCITLCFSVSAQLDNQLRFWDNVSFGGGIGLNFGNGFFNGTLAPSAIYHFNPYVSAGLGLNGTYTSQRDVFSSTIFGGSIIGLFNPVNEIQLSTEFEQLNVNQQFDDSAIADDNFWASALFLGVGYRTGNVTFGIRYDVLYDEDRSIYTDPWLPFVRFWF